MKWTAHLLIGFFLGIVIEGIFFRGSLQEALMFALISCAFALAPDIDAPKSKASTLAFIAAYVFIAGISFFRPLFIGPMLTDALLSFAILLLLHFALAAIFRPRHRGITHSLLFLFAISASCLWFFGAFFASAAFTGYFSHLCADGQLKMI